MLEQIKDFYNENIKNQNTLLSASAVIGMTAGLFLAKLIIKAADAYETVEYEEIEEPVEEAQ